VETVARDLGYEEIFLGVDPDNYKAIPLYLSLGYEPTGNHRIVGGDAPEGLPGEVFHDAIYRKRLSQFLRGRRAEHLTGCSDICVHLAR